MLGSYVCHSMRPSQLPLYLLAFSTEREREMVNKRKQVAGDEHGHSGWSGKQKHQAHQKPEPRISPGLEQVEIKSKAKSK